MIKEKMTSKEKGKIEFLKIIKMCRELQIQAQEKEVELFDFISRTFPETDFEDIESNAPNASNVQEAITSHIQYGDYSPEEIVKEIYQANLKIVKGGINETY